jgi:hypothetical protein
MDGTSGFFEIFSGAYSLRDLEAAAGPFLGHFGLFFVAEPFLSAILLAQIRRVTKECGLATA